MSEKTLLYRSWSPPKEGETEGKENAVWGEPLELASKDYDFSKPERRRPPPIPAEPPLPTPDENICGHCGAISMFAVEVCDLCGKSAKKSEPAIASKKKRKINFDEFEAIKRQCNRLKRKLADIWFEKPAPPERAKLEAKIEEFDKLLEDNIYLALMF